MDAVNLMTVHAAKGLEFPVVFVVNLARGTGGFRDPIRVVAAAGEDDVSVAVGDFRSDADEDAAARDAEESKRLLYVALTRARDRLYLASVLKDGTLQPGRGSLAAVLPHTLIDQFAVTGDVIEWRASSGAVHRLHGVQDPGSPIPDPGSPIPAPELHHVEPLTDSAPPRISVASMVSTDERSSVEPVPVTSGRLVGTLVHRLLQRMGIGDQGSGIGEAPPIRDIGTGLVRADEADGLEDLEATVNTACDAYESICACEDVRVLYQTGRALHEVPFTMAMDGRIVRGTIDCVVETAPGAYTLLEFKTGRERPEDRRQVELYLQALRRVFPGAQINGRVVYAGGESVLLV
jgi:ATP-dependent helicase/nuclease subunit A